VTVPGNEGLIVYCRRPLRRSLVGAAATIAVVVSIGSWVEPASSARITISTTFNDPVGDVVGGGPDVGAVSVSTDGQGLISFEIKTPNRPSLRDEDNLQLYLDVDENRLTGLDGSEYRVLLLGACVVQSCSKPGERNLILLQALNSRGYFSGSRRISGAFANGGWRLSISRKELRDTGAFNLALITLDPTKSASRNSDSAPDGFPSAAWRYRVSVAEAELTLTSASFDASWHQSRLQGSFAVAGRVPSAARLEVTLATLPADRTRATWRATVAAGAFRRSFRLPATLLPGDYRVRVTATIGTGSAAAPVRTVRLRAPREGVVARAYASASRDGPAATTLGGKRTEVWAHFVFAAQPKLGPLTVRWYAPGGRPFGPLVGKPNVRVVESFVRFAPGLRHGVWRSVLRAGGVVVKSVRIRIG
jgi:hypothetical protein